MKKWQVLVVAALGCAVTIVTALSRGAEMVAYLSAVTGVVAVAGAGVERLGRRIKSEQAPWPITALVFAFAIVAPLVVRALPARVVGAEPRPSATDAPAPATPTPTVDALARYCDLAIEFLGHATQFSGEGWQGKVTRQDFDPIIESANAALDVAPQEMRAPMTVLANSYQAAQEDWSDDNMIKNIPVAFATILSGPSRTAAGQVDAYENEHCF